MSKEKQQNNEKPEAKVDLLVSASVVEGALYFRQELASAEVADGSRIEVALNMGGGAVIVTRYPPKKGTKRNGDPDWTSWVVTPEALVRAVLAAVGPDKPAEHHAREVANEWRRLRTLHSQSPRTRAGGQEPVLTCSRDMSAPRALMDALDSLAERLGE